MPDMTHAELVERAARWLRGTARCPVVITEPAFLCLKEQPDAIGWMHNGTSILVECKVSIEDYRADRRKPFRRTPWDGLGQLRYYLTPRGLLSAEDLLHEWGLLEVHGRVLRKIVEARKRTEASLFAVMMERRLLLKTIRTSSATCNGVCCVRPVQQSPDSRQDPEGG